MLYGESPLRGEPRKIIRPGVKPVRAAFVVTLLASVRLTYILACCARVHVPVVCCLFVFGPSTRISKMSSSVCHAPLPARMEAFTTRLCLRAVDQYERLLQTHFNKVTLLIR